MNSTIKTRFVDIDDLKSRVNIVDVISAYTPLQQTSTISRWWHGTEHDSLVVNEQTQTYYWNSQSEFGDVIQWIMMRQSVRFLEAVDFLVSQNYVAIARPIPTTLPKRVYEPPSMRWIEQCQRALFLATHALDAFAARGFDGEACERWRFGYVEDHWGLGNALVIPVLRDNGRELIAVRYRILNATNGNKYRPHVAGQPPVLFNEDAIADDCVLVEGEFKAAYLADHGIPAVGVPGVTVFLDTWLDKFKDVKRVYVLADPPLNGERLRLSHKLSAVVPDVRIATLPIKPDDFVMCCGAAPLADALDMAWRLSVNNRHVSMNGHSKNGKSPTNSYSLNGKTRP